MGDKGPVTIHPLFTPFGIDFNLSSELLREKRAEKEVVIPFEIFNSNSFTAQTSKFIKDGKVFGKKRRLLGREEILKAEEEFEEVTQDHQMANLLSLRF